MNQGKANLNNPWRQQYSANPREGFVVTGRDDTAITRAHQQVALKPGDLSAINSRGLILEEFGHYERALADFDEVLGIEPNHPDALNNRGLVLARLGRFDEALAHFDQTISLYPDRMQPRYNRSIMRLALGDFTGGFREFESRWLISPLKDVPHPSPVPLWLGQSSLEGKTILIYHEQGYGDTLQFARYAPLLAERGAKVVLAVPPALRELMQSLPSTPKIVCDGDPMPFHELRCPLMSLPLAFGTTLETIPKRYPYLSANDAKAGEWRARLGSASRPRIGLAWSGRQYPPINYPRDMSLQVLRPLLDLDAEFISLQKEIPTPDLALLESLSKVVRHGEDLKDFADTAALIKNLDLVITVDTSVAHLAGAMGKPVWIMNRHATCWRWLQDRTDSPWYPSARLFRQEKSWDWDRVIVNVRSAAKEMIARWQPFQLDDRRKITEQIQKGIDLFNSGDYPNALMQFTDALSIDGMHLEALNNAACTLVRLERREEALSYFSRVLAVDPNHLEAQINLGAVLNELNRHQEALTHFDQVLDINPRHTNALNNRGCALSNLGSLEEALACYDKALSLDSADAQTHFNRSTVLLTLGDYTNGFREYESRWRLSSIKGKGLRTTAPLWLGQSDLSGKTILLHHEQGLGDTIQFVRYALLVSKRAERVLLRVPASLVQLIGTLQGNILIMSEDEVIPRHDFHCPLMSLPLSFGTTVETIPQNVPYLWADPIRAQSWKTRLGAVMRPRVGLVWRGRQYPPINIPRDMELDALLPLFDLDADFVSLQKEIPEGDRALIEKMPKLARHGESLEDFADAAALIDNLDLVITVDTSIAHLAGALGKPVWVMNRYASCWRWLRERSDSPWYPSLRLFRQPSQGDWASVVAAVRLAARQFIDDRTSVDSAQALQQRNTTSGSVANDRSSLKQRNVPHDSIGQGRAAEKIKLVCATRDSSEEFFAKSALGRSLMNFRDFPKGRGIEVRLFQKNTMGLASVYNIAIEESRRDPAILVFVHDDVLLCDFYWVERLLQALERYQVVGLSGNKRRVPRQPSWMYVDATFTKDDDDNFSGVVGHGEGLPNLTQLSIYGPPLQEVKLLDGVLLAVRSHLLLQHELRFDPQFDFDFYDMDFCRQAEVRGLKMGTCAMSVVHQSSGRLGTLRWLANYKKYLRKYME